MTDADLANWQHRMLAAIARPDRGLDPAAGIVADALPSSRQTGGERLDVYRRSYDARLVDVLRSVFPALLALLGDEVFDGFAIQYVRGRPSESWNLGAFGSEFAPWLETTRPVAYGRRTSDWTTLICDLAKLEWTLAEVFDGPGSEGRTSLRPEHLARLSPARRRRIHLGVTPSLRLLELRFPMVAWYSALRSGGRGLKPPLPLPGTSYVAVWRQHYVVRREQISRVERDLLAALQHGKSLADAIGGAARQSRLADDALASQLTSWFRTWGAAGMFESVD
jgi:hypothetical protein